MSGAAEMLSSESHGSPGDSVDFSFSLIETAFDDADTKVKCGAKHLEYALC